LFLKRQQPLAEKIWRRCKFEFPANPEDDFAGVGLKKYLTVGGLM
jgi:hypothetical protein